MEILLCRMVNWNFQSRLDPHKTASEYRWSLHIEGCHRQPGSRWQVLCIITVCGTRTGTWNQASKNRNRTWFFHERIVCRFQWSSCRLSSFFPKIPGKTCKGAAQAESLRKEEQPLHETEKENSQTPCSYRTSAERLSTQGIQKDNQFLRSCVHRIFEHERNEPGFKVRNECSW